MVESKINLISFQDIYINNILTLSSALYMMNGSSCNKQSLCLFSRLERISTISCLANILAEWVKSLQFLHSGWLKFECLDYYDWTVKQEWKLNEFYSKFANKAVKFHCNIWVIPQYHQQIILVKAGPSWC